MVAQSRTVTHRHWVWCPVSLHEPVRESLTWSRGKQRMTRNGERRRAPCRHQDGLVVPDKPYARFLHGFCTVPLDNAYSFAKNVGMRSIDYSSRVIDTVP